MPSIRASTFLVLALAAPLVASGCSAPSPGTTPQGGGGTDFGGLGGAAARGGLGTPQGGGFSGAAPIGGNGTGVKATAGSLISFGNNQISANGSNGSFTANTALQ